MNQVPLHVFVIHSPLALAMMELVVKHHRLHRGDVIAILVRRQRGSKALLKNKGIQSFYADGRLLESGYVPPRTGLQLIRKFDNSIKRSTRERGYHFYTFDLVSSLNQLAITHPGCVSVSLMEEGIGHMRPFLVQARNHFLEAEAQPLYSKRNQKRFFSTGWISPRATKLYSFSKLAWPDMESINVFDIDTLRSLSSHKKIDALLLIPAYRDLSNDTRLKELDTLVSLRSEQNRTWTVKFHPGNTRSERNYWRSHLRKRFDAFEVIDRDTFSVEAALASRNVSLLVAWGSSALVYAQMLGVSHIDLDSPSVSERGTVQAPEE